MKKEKIETLKEKMPAILYYSFVTAFSSLVILNILESVIIEGQWVLYAYLDGWGEQYVEMGMLFYIVGYSLVMMKKNVLNIDKNVSVIEMEEMKC